MAYKEDKDLKLFYSIGEVAEMIGVTDTLLRFWEREFPTIITPRKAGRTRQYTKEDIENIRTVYHLVKERGMTLQGARQALKNNKTAVVQTMEVINRLKSIRAELVSIRDEIEQATLY